MSGQAKALTSLPLKYNSHIHMQVRKEQRNITLRMSSGVLFLEYLQIEVRRGMGRTRILQRRTFPRTVAEKDVAGAAPLRPEKRTQPTDKHPASKHQPNRSR